MNEIDLSGGIESLVSQATDEFIERLDRGYQPEIEEFAARYPQISTVLRQVLPALQALRLPVRDPAPSPLPLSPAEGERGRGEGSLAASEPQATRSLGDFRILREIGRGGMGVVYEAEQISLARRVALKVLPFAATIDAKQLQRFKNEAQAAAHLQHQNIVPVYAVGCERGVHYYAMQFIEGQTVEALIHELRQSVDRTVADQKDAPMRLSAMTCDFLEGNGAPAGQPPALEHVGSPGLESPEAPAEPTGASKTQPRPRFARGRSTATTGPALCSVSTERSVRTMAYWCTVANLGVQAAKALDHAHSLGVVHRDIKPGNLLVDVRGNLWITDFGLAHCQNQVGLTMTGDFVGTLRYMSPEQALAQRGIIDHRTDLFSLGVTLYELLTLEPAFPGCDRQELLRQIASEEPRSSRLLNKSIPVDLETIVLKAMAKNPAERYATAQDLAEDLERLLRDEPIRAKRPTLLQRFRKWARRHQSVMWSAAVCLLLAGAMFTGSIGWVVRDRAALLATTEREAKAALTQAANLQAQAKWPEALEAVKRAEGFLAGGGSEELEARTRELRRDLEMVVRLQAIRLPQADTLTEGALDDQQVDAAYVEAFRDYGIDLQSLDNRQAAERIAERSIRWELVMALDNWAKVRGGLLGRNHAREDTLRQRLIAVAQAADPDELRNEVREALLNLDAEALNKLAASPEIGDLPLLTLSLLGWALDLVGARQQALSVLQRAQQKYPDDFHINFQLAWALDHGSRAPLDDVIRFYTVARSLRPRNVPVHFFLGEKLSLQGRWDEVLAIYRRAVELKSDSWQAHQHLGAALRERDQLDEAVAEFHTVMALQPNEASPHASLGLIFRRQDNLNEAIAEWRRAVELAPNYAEAHFLLASALRDKGEFAEAFRHAQRSHKLGSRRSDWPYPSSELARVAEQLVRLSPSLPRVLSGERAIADEGERLGYAELCYHQRQFERAARFYEEALGKQPSLAKALGGDHWYNAARCAALAGIGADKEATPFSEEQRARRRRQGRDWLHAALQQYAGALKDANLKVRSLLVQVLRQWLSDRNLKDLRDENFLTKLPTQEREACATLWNDVRNVLHKGMNSP
jgi:serine/threonine protein kinase/Flp pilus assembly protein TadD